MKDLMKMMKQAQELQGRMQQMQEELLALEIDGQAGAGMVRVRVNGRGDLKGLKIDPSLLKPGEADMIEDLVIAAFQDAKTKVEAETQERMREVAGGLPLPPGLKLF